MYVPIAIGNADVQMIDKLFNIEKPQPKVEVFFMEMELS